jgi:photosystem II stability/assembly factor-like uncharacterized protein
MLLRSVSVVAMVLIVASCTAVSSSSGTSALPSGATATPIDATPIEASLEPSPVPSAAVASATASSPPTPDATAVPSPTRPPPLDAVVNSIKLVSPGTGWVETDHGLLVTHDDGASWVVASPNGVLGTIGFDAIDGQVAFVASGKEAGGTTTVSIWHTTDGGQTWQSAKVASVPTPDISGECGCTHVGVQIDAVDPLVVFADIAVYSGTDSESHHVFGSRDGGLTWTALPFGIQANGSPADLAIQFLTADTGSIVFDERTFTTRTGWGHWTEYPEPRIGPVTYLDDRHWVMGLTDPVVGTIRIAESSDAGRTWTTRTRPIPKTTNFSVSFVSAATWMATSETTSGPANKPAPAEIWTTRDAGKTWAFVGKAPTSDTSRTDFIDPSHAWVPTDAGGLATTSDAGATWSVILH